VLRENYKIKTVKFASHEVLLNTDSKYFMGNDTNLNINHIRINSAQEEYDFIELNLPPLAAVILKIVKPD